MRKLLNYKFIIIVSSSLLLLILLLLASRILLQNDKEVFTSDGYILNLLSGNDEKYYFDDNTAYHQNLSSDIVFNDKDNNEISVEPASFVHYLDGGISFLKEGAILDLDSTGEKAARFYNINSDIKLSYDNGSYFVNSGSKKIILNNFMGRISENKYIVAGNNIKLKLSSDGEYISGDYFEILYEEKGIVIIQNQEARYQVLADGVFIYSGDVSIDLGNKIIKYMNNDVMSITFITISGDENIDIIEENKYKDSDDITNNSKEEEGKNNDTNSNNQSDNINNENSSESIENNESETSDIDKEISLEWANITSTSIETAFYINCSASYEYTYVISNSNSGKRVYEYQFSGNGEKVMPVKYSLTPDTSYLISIVYDDTYIYQTLLTTNDLGISILPSYSSSDSLSYIIKIDDSSLVSSANFSLYKYDKKSDKYKIQKDNLDNELTYNVSKDNTSNGEIFEFSNLDSNTTYYLKVNDLVINNISYSGVYDITYESKTLKKDISTSIIPKAVVNSRKGTVSLNLEGIEDDEGAISSYTYYIYDAEDIMNDNPDKTPAVEPIVKTNASSVVLDIEASGTVNHDNTKLETGKNYIYYAIIEYYDNEKYQEFKTVNSDTFISSNKPSVVLNQDTSATTFDKVVATIDIIDNSCTVPNLGRECYNESNSFNVIVTDKFDNVVYNESVNFSSVSGNSNVLRYELSIDGLVENSTYKVKVRANKVDMRDGTVYSPYDFPFDDGNSILVTKKLTSLNAIYTDGESSASHVINTNLKFVSLNDDDDDALYTTQSIKSLVLKLYKGAVDASLNENDLLATTVLTSSDINFGDAYGTESLGINITLEDTFSLSYDYLKDNDLLDENYTIFASIYYEDVSNFNNFTSTKIISLTNNKKIYTINPQLLLTNISDPVSSYTKRTNAEEGNLFSGIYDDTIVKYIVTTTFHGFGLESRNLKANSAKYYVYEYSNNQLKKVDFYVMNNSKLKRVSANDGISFDNLPEYDANGNISLTGEFYISSGNDINNHDNVMRRGNKYFISCEVLIGEDNDVYYLNSAAYGTPYYNQAGIFTEIESTDSMKQNPVVRMYPSSSTSSSITYTYEIEDYDNAIYDNNIYSLSSGSEIDYDLSGNNNLYSGNFEIKNLSNNSNYSIYLKEKLMNDEDLSEDNIADYVFDGFYDISDYNNKFEIYNDKNSVTFKVLFDSSFFNRVTSYLVSLSDEEGHNLKFNVSSLKSCGIAYSTDNVNRCFDIDYMTLKNAGMQTTDMNNANDITVNITTYYDSGLIKWNSDNDSDSFIFQNNSTNSKIGDYLVFSQSGTFEKYDPNKNGFNVKTDYKYTMSVSSGTYKFNITNNYSGYNISDSLKIDSVMTRNGLNIKNSSLGVINSKLVKFSNASCDNNKFVFSSITPFISYNSYTSLLNGAKLNMTIMGFDKESFKKENDKYYFYIDVWKNKSDATSYKNNWNDVFYLNDNTKILRRVKFEYNPDDGGSISQVIDGVMPDSTYYFTISAIMNNGVYYQFYDKSTSNTKIYEFSSSGDGIFQGLNTSIGNKDDDEVYGNRVLSSNINLSYASNYNFDLKYVICDNSSLDCSIDNFISGLSFDISSDDLLNSNDSSILLPDDFVYGKNYIFNIYAVYDLKNQDGDVISSNSYLLNSSDNAISVRKLVSPVIKIVRTAKMEDNEYYIDASVLVSDSDEVIDQKEFLFSALGDNNGAILNLYDGEDFIPIEDNLKYQKTIGVTSDVIHIRISHLSSDTQYLLGASANVYMNNDGEDTHYEVKKEVVTYSMHEYGFTPGEINLSATSNSIVTRFLGGTNFENVDKVTYSIGIWGNSEVGKISGSYEMSDSSHKFTQTSDEESMMFVINPSELITNPNYSKNGALLEKTFTVNLSFDIGENVYNTDELIVSYSKEKK